MRVPILDVMSRRGFMAGLTAIGVAGVPGFVIGDGIARFVDPRGDDDADGKSPQRAWRSLARAQGEVPPEGALLLRCGGTWRETLVLDEGVSLVAAYGVGAPPVLSGADVVTGRLLLGRGRIRSIALPEDPAQVFFDGVRGVRCGPGRLARPREWGFADGLLSVVIDAHCAPTVEVTTRTRGLDLRRTTMPRVVGLQIAHAHIGIDADTMAGGEIGRCTVSGCYTVGIRASSETQRDDVRIHDNDILDIAGTGIGIGGRLSRWTIRRNRVTTCSLLTADAVRSCGGHDPDAFTWSAGIKNWGWGEAGWQDALELSENTVSDCGPPSELAPDGGQGVGIWLDEIVEPLSRLALRRNVVRRCAARGIYVEKCDDIDVDYNLVVDCARTSRTGALALQANSYGYDVLADRPARVARSARRNRFRHNTVSGGWWTLEVIAEEPGCRLDDNLIQANILVSGATAGAWLKLRGGGTNTPGNGASNLYRRNCFGRAHGSALDWDGKRGPTSAALEAFSGGAVSESIDADPQFDASWPDLFALAADSPCRGAADQIISDQDVYGNPVPRGSAPDIGSVEMAPLAEIGSGRLAPGAARDAIDLGWP